MAKAIQNYTAMQNYNQELYNAQNVKNLFHFSKHQTRNSPEYHAIVFNIALRTLK